jgi:hypothetical protein
MSLQYDASFLRPSNRLDEQRFICTFRPLQPSHHELGEGSPASFLGAPGDIQNEPTAGDRVALVCAIEEPIHLIGKRLIRIGKRGHARERPGLRRFDRSHLARLRLVDRPTLDDLEGTMFASTFPIQSKTDSQQENDSKYPKTCRPSGFPLAIAHRQLSRSAGIASAKLVRLCMSVIRVVRFRQLRQRHSSG